MRLALLVRDGGKNAELAVRFSMCARMCQPVRTQRHLTCILCLHVMYVFHGGCSVCGSDSMRTVYSSDAAYPATRKCALADHMVRLREPALSC